jgi:hypothetical protein
MAKRTAAKAGFSEAALRTGCATAMARMPSTRCLAARGPNDTGPRQHRHHLRLSEATLAMRFGPKRETTSPGCETTPRCRRPLNSVNRKLAEISRLIADFFNRFVLSSRIELSRPFSPLHSGDGNLLKCQSIGCQRSISSTLGPKANPSNSHATLPLRPRHKTQWLPRPIATRSCKSGRPTC